MNVPAPPARTLLRNGRLLGREGFTEDSWVLMEPSSIVAVGCGDEPAAETVVDVRGDLLTAGLIDLHCHGGGGHAFDEGLDAMRGGLAVHRATGTTRSLVSLVSASLERTLELLRDIADLVEHDPLVLGAHLEGPYLAEARRGAHARSALRPPDALEIEAMVAAARGELRVMTLAPELEGSPGAIACLRAHGVVAAIGHTDADAAAVHEAVRAGAALVTHLFNAMPALHHRQPGPVGVALGEQRLSVEIIADGLHLAPEVIRLAFASAGARVVLVSDAMAAAQHGDGRFQLGELEVIVQHGIATVEGSSTIAGSTATLASAIRHCIVDVGVPPVQAIRAATTAPAAVLGRSQRLGRLAAGSVADVVRWSDDWRVRGVWANGAAVPRPAAASPSRDSLPTWP